MADQRITVHLLAKTRQFSQGMRRAGRDADTLTARLKNSESAGVRTMGRIGGAAVKMGTAFAGATAIGAAASIKAFADFDAKMNESLAIMGDISEFQRGEMSDAARQVALTTKFSAEEAAESYFYLASAGLDAEQSMAALPQVAAFAQAGMFDMARATDLATDAQSALGLTSDDAQENLKGLTRVTDVFVKANTLANTSVAQVSEAITNKLGGALRTYKIDVEEGTAVLAAYADQGVKGAEAGEALNIALRDMKRAATENGDAFAQANISIFDQNGNFRNMADIVDDLTGAFAGLSVQEQTLLAEQLGFQDRSFKNIQLLFGQADAIRTYEAALRDASGTTADVAGKQLLTLNEQFGLLGDKLKDVGIGFGEELAPMIQEMLPSLERMIEAFGRFAESIAPLVAGALKGIAGGIEAISIVGTKIVGIWDDQARAAGHLGVVGLKVEEWMEGGASAGTAYANAIAFLSDKSALTAEAMADLANQTEVDAISMANATAATLEHAQATGDSYTQIGLLKQALIEQATALVDTEQATLDDIEAAYGSAIAYEVAEVQRRRAAQAAYESADAAGDAGDAADDETEALTGLEKALSDAASAQESLADAMRAFADPTFAAAKAMDALSAAQAKVTELEKAGKKGTDEYAQAQLDLFRALLEAQGALDALDTSGVEEQISLMAETLGISEQAARDYFEALGLLDGMNVTQVVETRYTQSGTPSAATSSAVNWYASQYGNMKPIPRQHGGPLGAGQVSVVGERGPELFVPSRSGTVLSNEQLRSLGSNVQVSFVNPRLADDPIAGIRAAFAWSGLEGNV